MLKNFKREIGFGWRDLVFVIVGLIVFVFLLIKVFAVLPTNNYLKLAPRTTPDYASTGKISAEVIRKESSSVNPLPAPGLVNGTLLTEVESDKKNFARKIVKNGNIKLQVDDAFATAEKIQEIVKSFSGDLLNSSSSKTRYGGWKVFLFFQVPADKFEEVRRAIKNSGGEVLADSVNTSDVTAEYVDLEARLKNKRLEEESFQKMLDKAKTVDEILKITKEINRVRSEIDRLEGQKKYLDSQTVMSRISVEITEFVKAGPGEYKWKPARSWQRALHKLVLVSQKVADAIIEFVVVDLPFIVVGLILLWLLWKGGKIIKNRF